MWHVNIGSWLNIHLHLIRIVPFEVVFLGLYTGSPVILHFVTWCVWNLASATQNFVWIGLILLNFLFNAIMSFGEEWVTQCGWWIRMVWGCGHFLFNQSFCSSVCRWGTDLAVVWHIRVVVPNAQNWPKCSSQHVSSCMESDFCVFKDRFLLHIFMFYMLMDVWIAHNLPLSLHLFLNMENYEITFALPIFCFPKTTSNILNTYACSVVQIWCRHAVLSSMPFSKYAKIANWTAHVFTWQNMLNKYPAL
jgi:hypothetical protein